MDGISQISLASSLGLHITGGRDLPSLTWQVPSAPPAEVNVQCARSGKFAVGAGLELGWNISASDERSPNAVSSTPPPWGSSLLNRDTLYVHGP